MKRICVICDSEKEYACGFMEYVNRKKTLPFEAVACTSTESLLVYSDRNSIDILLISEKNMIPEVEDIPSGFTFVLDEGYEKNRDPSSRHVYKYQACDSILREVMDSISETDTDFMEAGLYTGKGKEIIGVYSPEGGAGCTTFALAAAAVYAEKKKVLFAELTSFSGLSELYNSKTERGLSDLLFYRETGKKGLLAKVSGTVYEGPGFDMLPPVSAPEDLFGVMPSDWISLFAEIIEKSVYDVLVLDIGIPSLALLDFCTTVYFPVSANESGSMKRIAFDHALEKSRYQRILQKTIPVYVPDFTEYGTAEEFYDAPGSGIFGNYIRNTIREEKETLWNLKCSAMKKYGISF